MAVWALRASRFASDGGGEQTLNASTPSAGALPECNDVAAFFAGCREVPHAGSIRQERGL